MKIDDVGGGDGDVFYWLRLLPILRMQAAVERDSDSGGGNIGGEPTSWEKTADEVGGRESH